MQRQHAVSNSSALLQSFGILAIITVTMFYIFFYTNWLGPYGAANDIYHLIIIIGVIFFTYLIFLYVVVRKRTELPMG